MREVSKPHTGSDAIRSAINFGGHHVTCSQEMLGEDCDCGYGRAMDALRSLEEQLEAAQHEVNRLSVALDATVARAESVEHENALLRDGSELWLKIERRNEIIREREEQLETLHYAADRLLATGLLGAVGWPSVSPEWKVEIEASVEALAKAVDAYPASGPS